MIQTYTLNDVTRFAYGELENHRVEGLRKAMARSKDLMAHYKEVVAVRRLLGKMELEAPIKSTEEAIMRAARSPSQRFQAID